MRTRYERKPGERLVGVYGIQTTTHAASFIGGTSSQCSDCGQVFQDFAELFQETTPCPGKEVSQVSS